MYLTSDNLVIRSATADDAAILCTWWNDGKVMEHAGFPKGIGTTVEEVINNLAADTEENGRRLILEIDTLPVGEMNYRRKENNVAEIGIKLCDFSKQNIGYGRIFLKMLIKSLFTDMGYDKIVLDTNLNNTRAQRVYETIGFLKVAVNIDSWTNQVGEIQSSVDYELLKSNYSQQHSG